MHTLHMSQTLWWHNVWFPEWQKNELLKNENRNSVRKTLNVAPLDWSVGDNWCWFTLKPVTMKQTSKYEVKCLVTVELQVL